MFHLGLGLLHARSLGAMPTHSVANVARISWHPPTASTAPLNPVITPPAPTGYSSSTCSVGETIDPITGECVASDSELSTTATPVTVTTPVYPPIGSGSWPPACPAGMVWDDSSGGCIVYSYPSPVTSTTAIAPYPSVPDAPAPMPVFAPPATAPTLSTSAKLALGAAGLGVLLLGFLAIRR